MKILPIAHEQLQRLTTASGRTVSLAWPDAPNMIYLDRCAGEAMPYFFRVGSAIDMARAATGHAYIAALDEPSRAGVMRVLANDRPDDWSSVEAAIQLAVQDVAERGFCLVDTTWRRNIRGIAAPLVSRDGVPGCRSIASRRPSRCRPKPWSRNGGRRSPMRHRHCLLTSNRRLARALADRADHHQSRAQFADQSAGRRARPLWRHCQRDSSGLGRHRDDRGSAGNDKFMANAMRRRLNRPEDFAGIAIYLMSEASSYHTTDCIVIDGGYSAL
jgi:hypothetical protein